MWSSHSSWSTVSLAIAIVSHFVYFCAAPAIGYTGRHAQTLLLHPNLPECTAFAIGCTVVLGKLDDPHEQEFLRGHDEAISALSISPTGMMVASGQLGSTHLKVISKAQRHRSGVTRARFAGALRTCNRVGLHAT